MTVIRETLRIFNPERRNIVALVRRETAKTLVFSCGAQGAKNDATNF
ncbi:hypothetical protein [Afipia sp. P52-10]|jgi:hypothetical protein|nr:hypothetical protein [Afipia sp. P52-10]